MATRKETAEFVLDQLDPLPVHVRAMFGEYALYCDDKTVAFICDDTVFLKPTEVGARWRQISVREVSLIPRAPRMIPTMKPVPQLRCMVGNTIRKSQRARHGFTVSLVRLTQSSSKRYAIGAR